MRVGILIFSEPRDEAPALAERLVEEGTALGHEVVRIYEPFLAFAHDDSGLTVLYHGQPLGAFDVIIARPNFIEEPSLHSATTYLLKRLGYRLVNGHDDISVCKNKLLQHVRLSASLVPMPSWFIARAPSEALLGAQKIGYPVMVKVPFGTHGKGVFYAERPETLSPIVDYLAVRDGNPVLVEEFIKTPGPSDLRVFIINGRVIAAMERRARTGDWRANCWLGGVGNAVKLTEAEKKIARNAAACFNLEIIAVDLLRSSRGPLIIELNSNPGFQELERVTGINVAAAIIENATSPLISH